MLGNLPLPVFKLVVAIGRNQVHRVTGGARRGGHRVAEWSEAARREHAREILDTLGPHLGDVRGKLGLEIGPGDDFGVCVGLVERGASRMYAAEKYPPRANGSYPNVRLIPATIEELTLPEPVDFALSNDVLEHVRDVKQTMRTVFRLLKPGGVFASSVDLRGHNCFKLPKRPLDFLTCSDRLWSALFSHIETSNRVRRSELLAAARDAGFDVIEDRALAVCADAYLSALRSRLLSRYRSLADEDLRTLQHLLVVRRPT